MNPEHWVYTIPLRLRSVFRRAEVEQELDEELRFHRELQARQEAGLATPWLELERCKEIAGTCAVSTSSKTW
jgi:hypothetical protein